MATTQNLQWLPADLRGLPAFPSNGMLYIYRKSDKDDKNELRAMIPSKSRIIIRFPEGTTIRGDIPATSVGTAQIEDGSIQTEDISPEMKEKLNPTYDPSGEGIKLGGI